MHDFSVFFSGNSRESCESLSKHNLPSNFIQKIQCMGVISLDPYLRGYMLLFLIKPER